MENEPVSPFSNLCGEWAAISDFRVIPTGERRGLNCQSLTQRQIQRQNIFFQGAGAFRRQAAKLQAAARGNVDQSVAMQLGKMAKHRHITRANIRLESDPRQKTVSGAHWNGEGRAEATAAKGLDGIGSGHHHASTLWGRGMMSISSSASTALRRLCHNPRRRADKNRSAITCAAFGFSRRMKSRTSSLPK
ncbi:hypothetical protein D3C86_1397320 [compost metagenome]